MKILKTIAPLYGIVALLGVEANANTENLRQQKPIFLRPQIQKINILTNNLDDHQRLIGKKGIKRLKLIKPNLRFNKIENFDSLNQFKNSLSKIPLSVNGSRVNLYPFVNSKASLTSLSKVLSPNVLAGSMSSKVEIFRVNNGGLVISEQLTYKRKPSSCPTFNSSRKSKNSIIEKLCFSSSSKKSIRSNDKLKLAVATFRQNIRTKSNLPLWARSLSNQELSSLQAKTNTQLSTLLLNTAKTTITRTVYMPPLTSVSFSKFNKIKNIKNKNIRNISKVIPNRTAGKGEHKLGENIYLTGFTFADKYEWSDHYEWDLDFIDQTIEFIPFISASYGLGIRFPLKINSSYNYAGENARNATIEAKISPFNGTTREYAISGLSSDLLFRGKEIVAEISGDAGVSYGFPILGQGTLRPPGLPFNYDFTNYLPDSLNKGDFTPPSYGQNLPLYQPIILPFDVLAGQGDYESNGWGFSTQAYPGVSLNLTSTDIGIKLIDKKSNNQTKILSFKQQRINKDRKLKATVKVDNAGRSNFTLFDPYYNLALRVYPGVELNGGIFLGGYSTKIDEFIRFPSLAITIPSNGLTFNCHKGTICSRTYNVNNLTKNVTVRDDERTARTKSQYLVLEKIIRIKDDDDFSKDDFYNKSNTITERSRKYLTRGKKSKFKPFQFKHQAKDLATEFIEKYGRRNYHCAGGEVRSHDWDEVSVDGNGVARLYVGIRMYEEESCNNQDKDASFNDLKNLIGNFQPILIVPPGETRTIVKKITNRERGSDDYIQITYKLKNTTNN